MSLSRHVSCGPVQQVTLRPADGRMLVRRFDRHGDLALPDLNTRTRRIVRVRNRSNQARWPQRQPTGQLPAGSDSERLLPGKRRATRDGPLESQPNLEHRSGSETAANRQRNLVRQLVALDVEANQIEQRGVSHRCRRATFGSGSRAAHAVRTASPTRVASPGRPTRRGVPSTVTWRLSSSGESLARHRTLRRSLVQPRV